MLNTGIKGSASEIVTNEKTAVAVGSGGLSVYATPAMIALMEKSAYESVQSLLEEGSGTVGTLMNIQHISATPVDMKVTAESELIAIDGRKLTFKVTAFDEVGKIGEGTHERFIINNEKFQAKTNSKKLIYRHRLFAYAIFIIFVFYIPKYHFSILKDRP